MSLTAIYALILTLKHALIFTKYAFYLYTNNRLNVHFRIKLNNKLMPSYPKMNLNVNFESCYF
jgi:hypothetical protein